MGEKYLSKMEGIPVHAIVTDVDNAEWISVQNLLKKICPVLIRIRIAV